MLDARARATLAPAVDRLAASIDRPWVSPNGVTIAGLVLGLASAVAAAATLWWPALALWLASRLCDGLDGPLARRRSDTGAGSAAGGFLDITADFAVYGSTVVGVAVGATHEFAAPWLPFLLVLLAYYLNGATFLAFSSIAERAGRRIDDGRSLSFLGGLAEGTETVVVHALWLVLPGAAWVIACAWATVVATSAALRIRAGFRELR